MLSQSYNIPSHSLLWFHLIFLPGFDWKILFTRFQTVDFLLGSRYQEYLDLFHKFFLYYLHIWYNLGTEQFEDTIVLPALVPVV